VHGTGRTSRAGTRASAPYDPAVILSPSLLGLALVIGLLVLLPARRVQLAGWSGRSIGLYVLVLWLGAMLVGLLPGARVLVPILLVAFIAPFIAAPVRLQQVLRRGSRGDPPSTKDVTPPDQRSS
jgi:hypothetical protein